MILATTWPQMYNDKHPLLFFRSAMFTITPSVTSHWPVQHSDCPLTTVSNDVTSSRAHGMACPNTSTTNGQVTSSNVTLTSACHLSTVLFNRPLLACGKTRSCGSAHVRTQNIRTSADPHFTPLPGMYSTDKMQTVYISTTCTFCTIIKLKSSQKTNQWAKYYHANG